jgi:uncharacterized protein (DUF433 family)
MLTISHSPVTSTPGVLGGTIVFTGTRVPAQTLIDYLNDGFSLDEFIEFFPSVSREKAEDFMSLIEDQAS